MGKALAVATVTASLRALLDFALNGNAALVDALGGEVTVTTVSPERAAESVNGPSVNLYLFRMVSNSSQRNPDMGFQGTGSTPARPPFGVDLNYLISAYGREPYTAEMLLGHVMDALHETPVLSRDLMRSALAHPVATATPKILKNFSTARDNQGEQVKVTPLTLTLEELTQVWAALHTPLVPAVTYMVSAVMI